MNTKLLFCIILWLLSLLTVSALTQGELEQCRCNADAEWLVGKGIARTEVQADKEAWKDLLSQISVKVESGFESISKEEGKTATEYCQSVLKTYSNINLTAAQKLAVEGSNPSTVYRYIKKKDMNKVFAERETLIKAFARMGWNAEQELRIKEALKQYYRSLILLKTHPDCNTISERLGTSEEPLLIILPARIERILSLTNFKLVDKRYREKDKLTEVEFSAFYDDKPLREVDLEYYTGTNWCTLNLNETNAVMEFYFPPDQTPNPIKVVINAYKYDEGSETCQDIRDIISGCDLPEYRRSKELRDTLPVSRTFAPKAEVVKEEPPAPKITDDAAVSDIASTASRPAQPEPDYQPYVDKVARLANLIQRKDYSDLEAQCNIRGKEYVRKVLSYGNARLVQQHYQLTCSRNGDQTIVRGLPVQFSFPQSGKKFTEQLAFVFDKDDKVEAINFAITKQAADDIIGSNEVKPQHKQRIISFIESYKTAYCLKDLDFVQKVFSDNALIIVGSMIYNDPTNIEGYYQQLGKRWKATRLSKQQYVDNLKQLFNSNEYINLHFEDNKLYRNNQSEDSIFGIQIHQYYYSQHYADEGYLFLMFDLTLPDQPKIYVRTWQPEKFDDGSIYKITDFFPN